MVDINMIADEKKLPEILKNILLLLKVKELYVVNDGIQKTLNFLKIK